MRQFARHCNKLFPAANQLVGLPKKLDQVAYISALESIAIRCRDHLMHYAGQSLNLHAEWDPLYTQFIYYFDEINLENDGLALSDHVFIINCRVMCCANPSWSTSANRHDFTKLSMRLRIMACQHTEKSRAPIDLQRVAQLHRDVAVYVTHFILLSVSHSEVVKFGEYKCEDAAIRNEFFELQYSSDQLRTEIEQIRAKARLALINDLDALIEHMTDVGDDDVNRGCMFYENPASMVRGFMVLAVRLFRCIELERRIIEQYPLCAVEIVIPKQMHVDVATWFRKQCDIELGTYFEQDAHRVAGELLLPIGARLDTDRYMKSRGEFEPIDNIMCAQLGYHVTDVIGKVTREPMPTVCQNPKHIMYEPLLLQMLSYVFTHRLRLGEGAKVFDFFKQYVVLPHKLHAAPDELFRQLLDVRKVMRARRPILFYLLRRWCVLYNGTWVQCEDLVHAVLVWLQLILTVYKGKLETGKEVKRFTDVMFPVVDHELEALKRRIFTSNTR